MTKNNWISLVVFILVCVAAIVGTVYGVVTHDEPGLIPGVQPAWLVGHPVGVCVATYGEDATSAESPNFVHASGVIEQINQRLGFEMLRPTLNAPCLILVQYSVPSERAWAVPGDETDARTFVEAGGAAMLGNTHCEITITNVTGELRSLVLMHELGHCMGLAHDPYNTSIMRPVQSITEEGQYPPRISDHDRELLRDLALRGVRELPGTR